MATSFPSNVHVSKHPCIQAKLSLLRSNRTNARNTKELVHEIALIVGCEAMGSTLSTTTGPTGQTVLGYDYDTVSVAPSTISLVPILRSGLGMLNAIETLLPHPVPVHHLGLFREPSTLAPVEYYNNLPNHRSPSAASSRSSSSSAPELAILLDPVIATGGTCAAAIQSLREWGVKRVLVIAILGAVPGVVRAAGEWPEGVDIWIAGVDERVTERGMIIPGLGDIGDRLFLTIGK